MTPPRNAVKRQNPPPLCHGPRRRTTHVFLSIADSKLWMVRLRSKKGRRFRAGLPTELIVELSSLLRVRLEAAVEGLALLRHVAQQTARQETLAVFLRQTIALLDELLR